MDTQVKTKLRPSFWLLYFVFTICVLGAVLAYGIVAPLYFLGYFRKSASSRADRALCRGIALLMRLQPWYRANLSLSLPGDGKGCMLVSNHRSHLDAFILLSQIPGLRILAKRSLFRIPLLGGIMRLSKQIPAERGEPASLLRALDRAQTLLEQGEVVHVFPEMTRCARGFSGVGSFSIAPFRTARNGDFTVIPLVFQGTDEAWPKGSLRIGFRKTVRARALPALQPREFASSEGLMREAQTRISRALGQ